MICKQGMDGQLNFPPFTRAHFAQKCFFDEVFRGMFGDAHQKDRILHCLRRLWGLWVTWSSSQSFGLAKSTWRFFHLKEHKKHNLSCFGRDIKVGPKQSQPFFSYFYSKCVNQVLLWIIGDAMLENRKHNIPLITCAIRLVESSLGWHISHCYCVVTSNKNNSMKRAKGQLFNRPILSPKSVVTGTIDPNSVLPNPVKLLSQ